MDRGQRQEAGRRRKKDRLWQGRCGEETSLLPHCPFLLCFFASSMPLSTCLGQDASALPLPPTCHFMEGGRQAFLGGWLGGREEVGQVRKEAEEVPGGEARISRAGAKKAGARQRRRGNSGARRQRGMSRRASPILPALSCSPHGSTTSAAKAEQGGRRREGHLPLPARRICDKRRRPTATTGRAVSIGHSALFIAPLLACLACLYLSPLVLQRHATYRPYLQRSQPCLHLRMSTPTYSRASSLLTDGVEFVASYFSLPYLHLTTTLMLPWVQMRVAPPR